MKNYKNKKYGIAVLLAAILLTGCDDYLDVNQDRDNPTVAPLDLLLTQTNISVGDATDFQFYTGDILAVYTHQMVVREEQDQYGTQQNNILLTNEWNNIYLAFTNLNSLIAQGTETESMAYVGIAQLEKAYLASVLVDLWGDVPYSQASQLTGGVVSPIFDNQEDVYRAVFELIETAKANLAIDGGQTPTTDDLFYNGDLTKWVKFANTLKLKLYNQVRSTTLYNPTAVNALITEDNFFSSNADDFEFDRTSTTSPTDERNRFYVASYGSTQFSTYQSPWFYEILKGMNPTIHTGNEDPRIPYYFFNQLVAGVLPPDAVGDNPRADYWDASTGFFSIRFGSVGPYRDQSTEKSYTYPGIFPAGGRYDDGQGALVDISSGTGVAPHRILTYDEFLYIKAEMMYRTDLTGDAAATLRQAMQASFAKVDKVVDESETTQTVPNLVGDAAVTTFIDNVIAEYNAAVGVKKLEVIMTQKWVATFGDPGDQYNDYRRTGYPVLANPRAANEYQLNNGDAYPLLDSQTVLNSEYQISLFWPFGEISSNRNAPQQKNPTTYAIFWDN